MADFQQNFLASLHGGMDFGQRIKQQRDQSQLNQLASQAYGAAPEQRDSLLSQMAGVDAGSAFQAEKQMDYSDERRNKTMVNMARTLMGAPEQARAGIYRQMVPTLSRFGMSELPQDYTPETAGVINQAAKSLVDASMGATGTPTDVRSFEMMTAGLSPEDKMRARRTNLGLDGRASSAGYGFFEFEGADGHKRMGRNNPRTGAREMYDEASGDFVPLGGMSGGAGGSSAPAPQAPGQQSFGDFTSLAGEFPGITMTSGMRTAERNQQVGGAGNSQHLTGTAADYAVPPQLKPAFISRAKQLGYQAIDEGDHIHLQLPRGARAGANLTVGRRAEDTAAAVEQAKTGVQLANLPTELGLRTNAAIAQTQGQEQVKQGVERAGLQATKARDAGTALELIAEARRLLPDATGGRLAATGDSVAGFFGSATEGAKANAALKTIAGQMTAKMPRMEGPQSDRDVQMYKEMAGDVANENLPVEIRKAALTQIERLQSKYASSAPVRVQSADDYNRLPPGALYTAPDGSQRRKR